MPPSDRDDTTPTAPNEAPGARRPATPAAGGASLHSEILARLRAYIVESNLPHGARIPERQLCELFGISRTPLREALKVLAAEGLIDLLPNRGARIKRLGEQDIRELFDLMAGLEALAGRLACESISGTELAQIEMLHHQMYGFYMARDLPRYFEANQAIHRSIVAAARNQALSLAYDGCTARIRRLRYSANLARMRDRWGEAMREHETILDALRRRAGNELSDILFLHLRHKLAAALEDLDKPEAEQPEDEDDDATLQLLLDH